MVLDVYWSAAVLKYQNYEYMFKIKIYPDLSIHICSSWENILHNMNCFSARITEGETIFVYVFLFYPTSILFSAVCLYIKKFSPRIHSAACSIDQLCIFSPQRRFYLPKDVLSPHSFLMFMYQLVPKSLADILILKSLCTFSNHQYDIQKRSNIHTVPFLYPSISDH